MPMQRREQSEPRLSPAISSTVILTIETGSEGGPSLSPRESIALMVASDSSSRAWPRIPYSAGRRSPDEPEITKNCEPEAPAGAWPVLAIAKSPTLYS